MKLFLLILFFSLLAVNSFSQHKPTNVSSSSKRFTISGYAKEETSGESCIGAGVFAIRKGDSKAVKQGVMTNTYGFFSLTLEEGDYTLSVNYLGFEDYKKDITLNKDTRLTISLKEKAVMGQEVEILGKKSDENVTKTQMGIVSLDIDKVKALPSFMGEVDILKTIQLLPGVQSAGEGNSGFYVRGGGPDQNLILLDEATVYQSGHLFGFFSVFNGDAVKNIELIKGAMPAQYGGRLSSVLDVSMKEGNNQSFHGEGGIGLIASRLTLEGPIKKNISSFMVSARRTYLDVLMKPFVKERFKGTGYYFYDLNAKLNYRLSDKDRIFISGYFGRDVFSFTNGKQGNSSFKVSIPWGNATTTLRWNHLISNKLFVNTSLIFTDYKFEFGATQSQFDFKLYSGIRDLGNKVDFSYFPNTKHNIKFGWNYVFHTFTPSQASAKSGDVSFDMGNIIKLYSHDGALYFSDDFDITKWLRVNAGLRYSGFMQVGPFERYLKNSLNGLIADTIKYKPGEVVAKYGGPEPRIAARFTLDSTSSIKVGFAQNYQYIHLASLSSVAMPMDIWMPSTSIIKPQFSTQYSIGYFRNFYKDVFETSVELYYKDMRHMVDYKEGALPQDNVRDNVDNAFTFGKGWAYGAEFFIKKRSGKFNGWVGYTLAWSYRKFDAINLGKTYPAKYDRRHDVSVALSYQLNSRWEFGSIFVFATGDKGTLPISWYFSEATMVPEYGERNAFTLASYHRLDLSATYTPDQTERIAHQKERWVKKMDKKGIQVNGDDMPKAWYRNIHSVWNFSVYNVYNRHNPYFIYIDAAGNPLQGDLSVVARQVSLFPILPSITWNFKF